MVKFEYDVIAEWSLSSVSFTHHPSSGRFEWDSPIAVHGGLEKLSCPEVPKQEKSNASADGQDVALERDRPDATAVIARGDFFDGLQKKLKLFSTFDHLSHYAQPPDKPNLRLQIGSKN